MTVAEQVIAPFEPGTAILGVSTPPPENPIEVDPTSIMLALIVVLGIVLAARKLGRSAPPTPTQSEGIVEGNSLAEFVAALNSAPPGPPPANATNAPALAKDIIQSAEKPADPVEEFFYSAPALLEAFRISVSQLGRTADETSARNEMADFVKNARILREKAGLASTPVWRIACLLEGLLKQIAEKPERGTPTTVRTIAAAVDLLHSLCVRGIAPDLLNAPPVRLLAVDDDPVSLGALAFTLKNLIVEPDQAADGKAAILLAQAYSYDAIFLDIGMPGVDGFEACARIHASARNRATPVVFVTSHSDLEARARSLLVGAHDLLSKPFLTQELGLKASTVVLCRRLQSRLQVSQAPAPSLRAAAPQIPAAVDSIQAVQSSVPVMEPAEA